MEKLKYDNDGSVIKTGTCKYCGKKVMSPMPACDTICCDCWIKKMNHIHPFDKILGGWA